MSNRTYYRTVATIFTIVGIMHLFRVINNWEAVLGGAVIPMWASWAALIIAGYLAVRGFQLAKR